MHSAALFPVMAVTMSSRKNRSVKQTTVRRIVRDVVNSTIEHKMITALTNGTIMVTAGVLFPITQSIIQGDNVSQRSGNVITVKDIDMQWSTNSPVGATITRFILLSDTMANTGIALAVTDVLAAATYNSGYNLLNLQKNRFKIYKDEFIASTVLSATQKVVRTHHIRVSKKVYYNNVASTSDANGKGAIYLLVISDATAVSDAFDWRYQLQYTDA